MTGEINKALAEAMHREANKDRYYECADCGFWDENGRVVRRHCMDEHDDIVLTRKRTLGE